MRSVSRKGSIAVSSQVFSNKKYMNTYQLYIDTLFMDYHGFIYFQWSRGQIKTQSLKHEVQNSKCVIKETLTMSVQVSMRNSQIMEIETELTLLNERSEVIETIILAVENWQQEISKEELIINNGKLIIKARKKQSVEISERGKLRRAPTLLNFEAESDSGSQMRKSDVMRQQMNKLRRQLEDAEYLNNKLRNDRTVLLSQVSQLEDQMNDIIEKAKSDIGNLRNNYQKKIEIRQKAYSSQIKSMINSFNEGASDSKRIIQILLRNNQESVKQIAGMKQLWARKLTQAEAKWQSKMTEQQIAQTTRLNQQIRQKNKALTQLQQLQENLAQLAEEKGRIQKQKQKFSEQLKSQRLQFEKQKEQDEQNFQDKVQKLNERIAKKDQDLKNNQERIDQYETHLSENLTLIERLKKQINESHKENKELQQTRVTLKNSLQKVTKQFEQTKHEYSEVKGDYEQLQKVHSNKQRQYEDKIKDLEEKIRRGSADIVEDMKKLNLKIKELEDKNQESLKQIRHKNRQIDEIQQKNSELKNKNSELNKILELGKEQLTQMKISHSKLQFENSQMKNLKEQLAFDNSNILRQLEDVKRQYQKLKKSVLGYQQHLKFAVAQLSNEKLNYDDIKNRFEASILDVLRKKQQQIKKNYEISSDFKELQRKAQQASEMEAEIQRLKRQISKNSEQSGLFKSSRREQDQQMQSYIIKIKKLENENKLLNRNVRQLEEDLAHRSKLEKLNHSRRQRFDLSPQSQTSIQSPTRRSTQVRDRGIQVQLQPSSDRERKSGRQRDRASNEEKKKIQEMMEQFQSQRRQNQIKVNQLNDQVEEFAEANNELKSKVDSLTRKNHELLDQFNSLTQKHEESQYKIRNITEGNQQIIFQLENKERQRKQLSQKNEYLHKKFEQLTNQAKGLQQRSMKAQLQYNKSKCDYQLRINVFENKFQQFERKQKAHQKERQQMIDNFDREKRVLKGELESMLEKINRLKNQKQLIEEMKDQQIKKVRWKVAELQGRMEAKIPANDLLDQYKVEIEEANKKLVAVTRIMNQDKLQHQNIEQQLRISKKKVHDQSKANQQLDDKVSRLEKTIDQNKRNYQRMVRDCEENQLKIERLTQDNQMISEQNKRLISQNSNINMEKKITGDKLANTSEQLQRKEHQATRYLKELQKIKQIASKIEDQKASLVHDFKKELEHLENVIIRHQKRRKDDQNQIKKLLHYNAQLEKTNQKVLGEKMTSYSEKLNVYVQEIGQIRYMLGENQKQLERLKAENQQLFNHNEILKKQHSQLKYECDRFVQNEKGLLGQLQKSKNEIRDRDAMIETNERERVKIVNEKDNLKKYYDEAEETIQRKQIELEEINTIAEGYMKEIKYLKEELDQNYIKSQSLTNLSHKIEHEQSTNKQLEEHVKSLQREFDEYKSDYTYRKDDVERLMEEVRRSLSKQLHQKIAKNQKSTMEKAENQIRKIQKQLNQLYQENARLKFESAKINNENIALQRSQNQLNNVREQLMQMRKNVEILKSKCETHQRTNNDTLSQLRKVEKQKQHFERQLSRAQHQVSLEQKKIEDEKRVSKKLQDKIQQLYRSIQQQHETERQLKIEIQTLKGKILDYENQIKFVKERQSSTTQNYTSKIKILETKLTDLSTSMQQHQSQIQKKFDNEVKNLRGSILRYNKQIQDKNVQLQTLNRNFRASEEDYQDIEKQFNHYRVQAEDELTRWQIEVEKMQNKLRDTEEYYGQTVQQLEEQLTSISKELTQARLNRQQKESQRLFVSEVDDRFSKRNEERLKMKDKKIEQLKVQIYQMEDTLHKMKKKQDSESNFLQEIEGYKNQINNLREICEQKEMEIQKLIQLNRELKQCLNQAKDKNQQLFMEEEQKQLQIQSLQCELKTVKDLYEDMQKQLAKRKGLYLQNEGVSDRYHQIELQLSSHKQKVLELEEANGQLQRTIENMKRQATKKHLQSLFLQEQIKKMTDVENKKKNSNLNPNQSNNLDSEYQTRLKKKELKERDITIQQLKQQNFKLREDATNYINEISICKANISSLEEKNIISTNQIEQMEELLEKNKQSFSRVAELERQCNEEFGLSLQQAVQGKHWLRQLRKKEQKIESLSIEIDELRFLEEGKDYAEQQMKKEIYEYQMQLQLKSDEMQIQSQQLYTLRKLCENLQKEKNDALIKLEKLKIQIENLVNTGSEQMRNRVEEILQWNSQLF